MRITFSVNNETNSNDVEMLLNKADIIINSTITKVNSELIKLYWLIGKMIVEYKRQNNSKYGDKVVKIFNENLYAKYGAGFNRRNMFSATKFYELFQEYILTLKSGEKVHARALFEKSDEYNNMRKLFRSITWTHFRELLSLNDIKIIEFYLYEIENKNMSYRELITYMKSMAYDRTIINQRNGKIKNKIEETLKDPVILNIRDQKRIEKELETVIVKNILTFKKEIGNDIMFYDNQYKINVNSLTYKVDIVLYDKKNSCFILVDLKVNKVSERDISQMKFYVDYFNRYMKYDNDEKTIGLIICETKDIRVTSNDSIYQIRYLNEIPKEDELLRIIGENKIILLKTESLNLE